MSEFKTRKVYGYTVVTEITEGSEVVREVYREIKGITTRANIYKRQTDRSRGLDLVESVSVGTLRKGIYNDTHVVL